MWLCGAPTAGHRTTTGAVAVLALVTSLVAASPGRAAAAGPPGNDVPSGAVPLQLGVPVEQDTREATTDADDAALNASCGAPATNASVWYSFTSTTARDVVLDASASDYEVGFLVFQGTPAPDSLVDCGPQLLALQAQAGTTYTVMVFSDTDVAGGTLDLTLSAAPPRPRVSLSLARYGRAFRNGDARLRGTYSCTSADSALLFGSLLQRAGRLKIRGDFFVERRCDGRRHRWFARVVSPFATYARGRARGTATVSACGLFECSEVSTAHRVRLRGPRGAGSHRSVSRLRTRVVPHTRMPEARPLVERQGRWPAG